MTAKTMEHWFSIEDRDIRWIVRENLKKHQLQVADPGWVRRWQAVLHRNGDCSEEGRRGQWTDYRYKL